MAKEIRDMVFVIILFVLLATAMGITYPALLGEIPKHDLPAVARALFFFACLFGLRVAFEKE